jgi:hypothetical protein
MSSANFNPYVQGWRVEQPSIFGALPGANGHGSGVRGGGDSAADAGAGADPNATIFHITDFHPNVLNASVVDARGYQCYKIVTDAPQQPQRTVFYDMYRRTVALIDWAGVRPSVEMPGLLPRQTLRRWLRAGPDRAYVPLSFLSTATSDPDAFSKHLDLRLWSSGASPTSGFPMGNAYA